MDTLIIRNDNQFRISRMAKAEFGKWDKGAILLRGMAVTFNRIFPKVGEPKFIFAPDAISQDVIDEYMKKPLVFKIHDDWEYAIGETLKMEIRDDGLYAEVIIRPAGKGKDIVEQIEANPIRSFSIGFFMESPDYDEQLGAYKVTKVTELFDLSVVNLGRDEEAVFEIAQTFNLKRPEAAGNTRRRNMPEVKPITQEEFQEVKDELDGLKVTLGSIDPKAIEKIARLEKIVEDHRSQDEKTRAEFKEVLDRISDDYTKAVENLSKMQKEAMERAVGDGERNDLPITPQQALFTDDRILKRMFTKDRFDQISEFRNMSDLALFGYQFTNPQRQEGRGDRDMIIDPERFSKMKIADPLNRSAHRFAMDTATDAEGADFIPVGYSTELIRKIRLASRVDQLFQSFRMREASEYINVEGDDILPTRMTQTTAVQTARADSTEQTPGTDQVQFSAEKLRTRIQLSGEMTEDSMIEIFDYVFGKSSIGFARGLDKWWISGDNANGTDLDSGDSPASTDIRYCGDGLRVLAHNNSTNTCTMDLGTFSFENVIKLFSLMGKYAVDPTKTPIITSVQSYFLNWMGKIGKDYMSTIDKAGSAAVIFNGQVAQAFGRPLILSEWILATLDSTGAYTGTGNSQTIELVVNTDAHRRGIWRPMTTEVVRNPHFDIWDVITWHRTDIQKVITSTEPSEVVGLNVPTL